MLADEGLFLLGGFDLGWRQAEEQASTLSWNAGSRVFEEARGEDQLVHLLAAGHALQLGEAFVASAELRRRDQALRSGERDSADTAGSLALEWQATRRLAPRIRIGWRHSDWWPDESWSASGPLAAISLQARPLARHLATASYEFQSRKHRDRRESLHLAQLGWSWRRGILLSGSYLLGVADSDPAGYDSVRHRFQLLVGSSLPAGLLLQAQGVLQLVRFPQGFRLDPSTVEGDEEGLSTLSLKLARPLGGGLSLEARYQLHLATFVGADLDYERQVIGTALAWRF